MSVIVTRIGPHDHGRPMGLAEFGEAEFQPGYLYELDRGVVAVSDIPGPRHLAQVDVLRTQLYGYRALHPQRIHRIASGGECKILLSRLVSERHPDLAVYKKRPPPGVNPWAGWVPELVVEVISPGSEVRDYEVKREEYLQFGIQEYWIFDAELRELSVHRRSGGQGRTRVVKPPQAYKTRLFPGLEINCATIFDEADAAE